MNFNESPFNEHNIRNNPFFRPSLPSVRNTDSNDLGKNLMVPFSKNQNFSIGNSNFCFPGKEELKKIFTNALSSQTAPDRSFRSSASNFRNLRKKESNLNMDKNSKKDFLQFSSYLSKALKLTPENHVDSKKNFERKKQEKLNFSKKKYGQVLIVDENLIQFEGSKLEARDSTEESESERRQKKFKKRKNFELKKKKKKRRKKWLERIKMEKKNKNLIKENKKKLSVLFNSIDQAQLKQRKRLLAGSGQNGVHLIINKLRKKSKKYEKKSKFLYGKLHFTILKIGKKIKRSISCQNDEPEKIDLTL